MYVTVALLGIPTQFSWFCRVLHNPRVMLPHLSCTHVVVMCLLISCAVNNVIADSSNYTKVSACYAPDREALLSVSRAAGFVTNYNISDDCCSWDGIICGDANSGGGGWPRRVTEISATMEYNGSAHNVMIPTSLCNLSALTSFDLDFLIGAIAKVSFPECVGTHLMLLNSVTLDAAIDEDRSCNSSRWPQLNIPASFSRLSTLQSLHLMGMRIDSQSLRHIVSLPSLVTLSLYSCPLEPSSLPLIFATPHAISNLTSLTLSQCCLSGPLPPFTNMPLLRGLYLHGNSLSSTLEDFILHSNFSQLERLDLHSNNLSGPLPHLFKNLTELHLQNNQFSGPFPDILNSPLLFEIDLSYNHFSGALPESWQHLSSLRSLDLSGNTIEAVSTVGTSRRLPEWLFRLPNLSSLYLASTGLHPGDCECHGMLSLLNQTLEALNVSENNLTGPNVLNCIASFNFTFLGSLSLSHNPLAFDLSSAAMPTDVFQIEMQNCSLFGSIPIQIFKWITGVLDLSFNGLTGIHGKIHNQTLLCPRDIFLAHNLISADISFLDSLHYTYCGLSYFLGNFLGEYTFDASYNNLTGLIPTSASTSSLFSLYNRVLLNDNLLMGSISPDLGRAQSRLQTLNLHNNALDGSIPTSILNLTALQLLDLSYNHLEGNFTTLYSSIEQPTALRVLLLSHNRIQGSIPPSFGALTPDLQVIDLSNNKLSGEIPRHLPLPNFRRASPWPNYQVGTLYEEVRIPVKGVVTTYKYELVALTSLDVSYNHLIGAIPPEIGDFIGLRYLNLSRNMLSGHIPTTLYKLQLLESMDLSYNQLRGKIPSNFSNLTSLEIFNVSFNEGLKGPIPHGGAFQDNISFIGCPHLCGFPILDACSDHPEESPEPTFGSTEKDKDEKVEHIVFTWMREWIAIPGFILGIIAGFVGTLWILHGKSVSVRALSIMWHVSM